MNSGAAIYGLPLHARSLCAIPGNDDETHRFLVGTCSVQSPNEVRLLEFDDDTSLVSCRAILPHPHPIVYMEGTIESVMTVSSSGKGAPDTATLYGLGEIDPASQDAVGSLESVWQLPQLSGIQCTKFHPIKETLMSVQSTRLAYWDMSTQSPIFEVDQQERRFGNAVWDALHGRFVVCDHDQIAVYSLDTPKPCITISDTHKVESVDANPNKPHQILTSGRDCLAKFWDLRQTAEPLRVLSSHSHWVLNAKYNRFHDQLVLTGGSDAKVNLWNVSSVSSALPSDMSVSSSSGNEPKEDKLVQRFGEHEESVYGLEWSYADAWVFASLSYNGRVAFSRVPRGEKYNVLL